MPNGRPPADPHIPGIANLLARPSLIWLQTLQIVVSIAALSSARLFPGGNASSTTGFPIETRVQEPTHAGNRNRFNSRTQSGRQRSDELRAHDADLQTRAFARSQG